MNPLSPLVTLFRSLVSNWKLLLALSLAGYVWFVTQQRDAYSAKVEEVKRELSEVREELRVSRLNERVREDYERKIKEDSGAVNRVVRRIERVCNNESVQVPQAPRVVDETKPDSGDFARKLGRDLATCQAELRRADALREWIRGVSEGE